MNRRCIAGIISSLVSLLLFPLCSHSQHVLLEKERPFLKHLSINKLYSEKQALLSRIELSAVTTPGFRDSLLLEKAALFYTMGRYDSSAACFTGISKTFVPLNPCLACFNDALLSTGNYKTLLETAPHMESPENQRSLVKLQLICGKIGNRSLTLADTVGAGNWKELEEYTRRYFAVGKKSPVLAGAMSLVVPGSGKWYAGKKWQGIVAFTANAMMGLQAYESYSKGGVSSPRFIASIALFSVFYTGNIWGSVLDARKHSIEKLKQIDHEILEYSHTAAGRYCSF